MSDALYHKFVKRWEEVTDLPPQSLGPLTPYYKDVVRRLKIMPWPVLLVAAIIMVTCIYLIVGSTISLIVSILQKGF
jgi:hypothetical protein